MSKNTETDARDPAMWLENRIDKKYSDIVARIKGVLEDGGYGHYAEGMRVIELPTEPIN